MHIFWPRHEIKSPPGRSDTCYNNRNEPWGHCATGKKPVTKHNYVCDSAETGHLTSSDSWRQNAERWLPRDGGGRNEESSKRDRVSDLQDGKSSGGGRWGSLHNSVSVLHATKRPHIYWVFLYKHNIALYLFSLSFLSATFCSFQWPDPTVLRSIYHYLILR